MRGKITYGIEIEQFPNDDESVQEFMHSDGWHMDGSGPQETDYGPTKQPKRLLTQFTSEARDAAGETPWDWHSSQGLSGCGSHVHIGLADVPDEDYVEAMTIAYNTAVTMTPLLAPFFCHNWSEGFRSSGSEVRNWASPQTVRYSNSTMEHNLNRHNRNYDAVTLNTTGDSDTIELRLSDAHPAFSLVGAKIIGRTIERCLEREESPKLWNSSDQIRQFYGTIYGSDLMNSMQIIEPFCFKDDRGIPGLDEVEFDSMWDFLQALLVREPFNPNAWDGRVVDFIKAEVNGPENELDGIWATCDDEFSWSEI